MDKRSTSASPAPDRKIDFEILDRFHGFTSEIVRIALLAPGSLVFFVALAGHEAEGEAMKGALRGSSPWLEGSFICFGIAILAGLLHRYVSTDAMVCIIQRDRKHEAGKPNEATAITPQIKMRFELSRIAIFIAPTSLALGAGCLLLAFFKAVTS